jgi:stage V sporulation protein G
VTDTPPSQPPSTPEGFEITAVRIYPFDTRETGGRTVAYAEIEIGGALLLRGIRVLESESRGLFIGYPSQRARRDRFVDLVVPLTKEAQQEVRRAVIEEYKSVTGWEPAPKEGEERR